MEQSMADSLVIELSFWIIQDGNYGDFHRGKRAAFALELLTSEKLSVIDPTANTPTPSLRHKGEARYGASAQVVHVTDHWWVIDAGVLLYQDGRPPPIARKGSWVQGEIGIGIDPFPYFERHAREAGAPALIYDWTIEKIEMQTAPLIEVQPRLLGRDPTRLGWREIKSTDAWGDDGGRAEYLLHCQRIEGPARRAKKK